MNDNEKDLDLEELLKNISNVPPITGSLVSDYTTFLNKEMSAILGVWAEYKSEEVAKVAEQNPFIINHQVAMIQMYRQLLVVADAAKDPVIMEQLLKKMAEEQGSDDSNDDVNDQ